MEIDFLLRGLQELTEHELISAVVAPLLKTLAYERVSVYSGPTEAGKDLICWQRDALGDMQLHVVQVKRFKPSRNVASDKSFSHLVAQLSQASESAVPNIDGRNYLPSSVILITPYEIDERTLATRFERYAALRQQRVTIIDGPRLAALLRKHLPDLVQRLAREDLSSSAVDYDDDSPIAGPLRVYIDGNRFTAEEKGELLSLISELYSLQRGDRLVIDSAGTAEPVSAAVGSPDGGQP